MMKKLLIISIVAVSISGHVYAGNSDFNTNPYGEGNYYGGGYGSNSGLQNSHGAYGGGSNQQAPYYGVPDHPAGEMKPCLQTGDC